MTNDIDTLMSRIEEINAKSADELSSADIDDIIAFHRRARDRKASGEKSIPQQRGDVLEVIKRITKANRPSEASVKIPRRV